MKAHYCAHFQIYYIGFAGVVTTLKKGWLVKNIVSFVQRNIKKQLFQLSSPSPICFSDGSALQQPYFLVIGQPLIVIAS